MTERTNDFARGLFAGLPARYDLLAELLSFGQNRRWRRTMVDRVIAGHPSIILDVATGTAGVARQLARKTAAYVCGVDVSPEMVRRGMANVDRDHLAARVGFAIGAGERLPIADASVDALTFTYLLRYVDDPATTLVELARVVKPGGRMASLEFYVPPNRFLRGCWWCYTRIALPAAGGLAGRAWWRVGRFLGPSISQHYTQYPLARTVADWHAAGLDDVKVSIMSLGGGVVMSGRKRDG